MAISLLTDRRPCRPEYHFIYTIQVAGPPQHFESSPRAMPAIAIRFRLATPLTRSISPAGFDIDSKCRRCCRRRIYLRNGRIWRVVGRRDMLLSAPFSADAGVAPLHFRRRICHDASRPR